MKTRHFLAPLAASISALLGIPMSGHTATSSEIAPETVSARSQGSAIGSLILQRSVGGEYKIAQDSHVSHASHESHASHASHMSGM